MSTKSLNTDPIASIRTVGGRFPASIGRKEPRWVEITDVNDDEFYVRGYTRPLRMEPEGTPVPERWTCGTELLVDGKRGLVLQDAYTGSREGVSKTIILRPVKYILFPVKSQLVGVDKKRPIMLKVIKHGHMELVCECIKDSFTILLKARIWESFPSAWVEGSILEVNVSTYSISSVTIPNASEVVRNKNTEKKETPVVKPHITRTDGKHPRLLEKDASTAYYTVRELSDTTFWLAGYQPALRLSGEVSQIPSDWNVGTRLLINANNEIDSYVVDKKSDPKRRAVFPVQQIQIENQVFRKSVALRGSALLTVTYVNGLRIIAVDTETGKTEGLLIPRGQSLSPQIVPGATIELTANGRAITHVTAPSSTDTNAQPEDYAYPKRSAVWDLADVFQFIHTDGMQFDWKPPIRKADMSLSDLNTLRRGKFVSSKNESGVVKAFMVIPEPAPLYENDLNLRHGEFDLTNMDFVRETEHLAKVLLSNDRDFAYEKPRTTFSDQDKDIEMIGVPRGTSGIQSGVVTSVGFSGEENGTAIAFVTLCDIPDRGIILATRIPVGVGDYVTIDVSSKKLVSVAKPIERLDLFVKQRVSDMFQEVKLG